MLVFGLLYPWCMYVVDVFCCWNTTPEQILREIRNQTENTALHCQSQNVRTCISLTIFKSKYTTQLNYSTVTMCNATTRPVLPTNDKGRICTRRKGSTEGAQRGRRHKASLTWFLCMCKLYLHVWVRVIY